MVSFEYFNDMIQKLSDNLKDKEAGSSSSRKKAFEGNCSGYFYLENNRDTDCSSE